MKEIIRTGENGRARIDLHSEHLWAKQSLNIGWKWEVKQIVANTESFLKMKEIISTGENGRARIDLHSEHLWAKQSLNIGWKWQVKQIVANTESFLKMKEIISRGKWKSKNRSSQGKMEEQE